MQSLVTMEDGGSDAAIDVEGVSTGLDNLRFGGQTSSDGSTKFEIKSGGEEIDANGESDVQITSFSEILDNVTLHFQIIRLVKQIYVWIGCNSAKFGHLYAAAPTRPNNTVSVSSLLGGSSDNIGSSIARRLVLRTGLNVVLACDIPRNSPLLEAGAEKMLIQELISLGYAISSSKGLPL